MNYNQTFTLLFWHRKSKPDAEGKAPIYCRISVDGVDAELFTGEKIFAEQWNNVTKKVKGGEGAQRINLKMSEMVVDLNTIFKELRELKYIITPLLVKNSYIGLASPKPPVEQTVITEVPKLTILQAADKHIANFSRMVDKGIRSKETLKQWRATRNKIFEFVKYEYHADDVELEKIQFSFATKMYQYLTVEREEIPGEAAAKKQTKNIKEILF